MGSPADERDEQGHDAVAEELVDDPAVLVDRDSGRTVIRLDQAVELRSRGSLRQAGRAADVGEDHADRDLGAAGLTCHLAETDLAQRWVVGHRAVPEEARERPTDAMERGCADLAARRRRDVAPSRSHLEQRGIRPGQEPSPQRGRRIFVAHLVAHGSDGSPSTLERQTDVACQPSTSTTSRVRGPWTPSTRCSSMSLVADGPLIHVCGRVGSRRASASGTLPTTWSAITTHTWRSGRRLIARRPWSGPASRTIVPVSAIAIAQPVTTPSRPSRFA